VAVIRKEIDLKTEEKLALHGYQCFDWKNPAILEFIESLATFVGPNNSGKSGRVVS
jgi:hypothetical protein